MRNPIFSLMRYSWKYAVNSHFKMILFIIFSVIANFFVLFEPYVFGQMLEEIQKNGDGVFRNVVIYLIILGALPMIFWLFHGVSRVLERTVSYHILLNYQSVCLRTLFSLPMEWHKNNHSGKNIDKVNRAGMALLNFTSDIFVVVEIAVTLIGSFALLFFMKPYIGLISVIVPTVAFGVVVVFDIVLFNQYKKLNSFYNQVGSAIQDYLSNVFTVLTMRFEKSALNEYVRRFMRSFSLYRKNVIMNECKWASVTFIITLLIIGVLAFEIVRDLRAHQVIIIGTLYTLYAYMHRIGDKFYQFAWKYSDIVEQDAAVASAENIFGDYKRLVNNISADAPVKWKSIRVENLRFTYEDEQKIKHQIKDVNLDIMKGEKIAFVGESGCGKSTVLGLLRGIYKARGGNVYVDSEKLKHGVAHLSDITTLMPQEPEIFENTIKYNVAMGFNISDAKILKMLKWARFDSVLKKLSSGLKTNIAEKGVNLSGGEKQRLALARGLLAAEKSDIVLMDEPTSSVDMQNERLIFANIFQEFRHKTIIASVHRLSLLPMFDTVYYFQNGRILKVERK
ncbi:ABC transporter ATP-binding protein [Candidatus Peregrinibacteria bacterium]|nr:ABC transporter ATP-binding protein [Candidatus Peregrinibacteria bacterium]